MSLVDTVKALHTQADASGTGNVSPDRQYDQRTIDPTLSPFVLNAIDELHPNTFAVVDPAILKSSKTKAGVRSTLWVVKATFPVKCSISMWNSGKIRGDGIQLDAILAKAAELKAAPAPEPVADEEPVVA